MRVETAGDMTICCGVHVWISPEYLKEALNLKCRLQLLLCTQSELPMLYLMLSETA